MLRHIRAPDTAPEDFVMFWRNLHTEALQVPLNLRVEKDVMEERFEAPLPRLHYIGWSFGCSFFDPAVPPPGQWSAANAHPGPKVISSFPVGHFAPGHPGQDLAEMEHQRQVSEFFGFPGLT